MALYARSAGRVLRPPSLRAQCHRIRCQHYSSAEDGRIQPILATDDAVGGTTWFEELRQRLLRRSPHSQFGVADHAAELQLFRSLQSFVPQSWEPILVPRRVGRNEAPGTIGHHLIYCNSKEPLLLPDGTDNLHSPGEPFVRRMWAGGRLRVKADSYTNELGGWKPQEEYLCVERIKDVRLSGSGSKEKIVVTVERRFARVQRLAESRKASTGELAKSVQSDTVHEYFINQPALDGWGDALLVEERDLIFMRKRSKAELEDVKAGKTVPTKYLEPPGIPDFSVAMTPTSALLFRFSALTFNAHAIHLDRDYARNVEGHRNLLVHGPLTLLLMIKLISAHLYEQPGRPQIVQNIDYRNLAPLYCDEEMRLCARERPAQRGEHGSVYDVWINGPTGGMAVKGVVRTRTLDRQDWEVEENSKSNLQPEGTEHPASSSPPGAHISPQDPKFPQTSNASSLDTNPTPLISTSKRPTPSSPSSVDTSRRAFSISVQTMLPKIPKHTSSNSQPTPSTKSHRNEAEEEAQPVLRIRHITAPPSPMKVHTSPLTRYIGRRINPWKATAHIPVPKPPTLFAQKGVRRVKIKKLEIRMLEIAPSPRYKSKSPSTYGGESLMRPRPTKRARKYYNRWKKRQRQNWSQPRKFL